MEQDQDQDQNWDDKLDWESALKNRAEKRSWAERFAIMGGVLPRLRPLLILGRVSNLPTVWSNCLAGWLLGSVQASGVSLALLMVGATLIYVAGMYLNDAFDADFDRQHRPERPIPTGQIGLQTVWIAGGGMLVAGFATLLAAGASGWLCVLLAGSIVVYDAVHKAVTLSPWIMAACRFFLVLAAASVGDSPLTGAALWSAIALGLYVVGLSSLARVESTGHAFGWWPVALLSAPLILAFIVNDGAMRLRGVVLILLLAAWILRCVSLVLRTQSPNIGRAVSGLLAGIVLVDWVSVGGSASQAVVFLALFAAALVLQRFVPAT